jgi:SAM-dependent methyltransferase
MTLPIVNLPTMSDPLMADIRAKFLATYEEKFGHSTGKGLYSNSDWRRLEFAVSRIPSHTKSILDIGAGPGALLNYLTISKRFERVTAIDKAPYTKFVGLIDVDLQIMDVTSMSFEDNSFETVFCMEVLEHLTPAAFEKAVSELRRVAKHTLLMSVPFEEPEPIPAYHKQRFDETKLRNLFPAAKIERLSKGKAAGCDWAVITETF